MFYMDMQFFIHNFSHGVEMHCITLQLRPPCRTQVRGRRPASPRPTAALSPVLAEQIILRIKQMQFFTLQLKN